MQCEKHRTAKSFDEDTKRKPNKINHKEQKMEAKQKKKN